MGDAVIIGLASVQLIQTIVTMLLCVKLTGVLKAAMKPKVKEPPKGGDRSEAMKLYWAKKKAQQMEKTAAPDKLDDV